MTLTHTPTAETKSTTNPQNSGASPVLATPQKQPDPEPPDKKTNTPSAPPPDPASILPQSFFEGLVQRGKHTLWPDLLRF